MSRIKVTTEAGTMIMNKQELDELIKNHPSGRSIKMTSVGKEKSHEKN